MNAFELLSITGVDLLEAYLWGFALVLGPGLLGLLVGFSISLIRRL